jgi:diguanylate cyclase (GGDEF)-like protein
MLDLDRFKEVNDTLGHQHGDLLLRQVAQGLSGVLRPSDTVARFGGDECALLLSDGGSEAGVEVANRITEALEAPFFLPDATIGVEVSIGIAAATAAHEQPTLEELLRQADIAMFKAKADRSGFAHYAACNDDGTLERLTLIGELLGVEVLLRWQHPSRGLLLPGEFIELAEGSTLIKRLTTVILDSTLRSCRTWLDQGLRLPVAVNISARSLCDPEFPTIISDHLARAGVAHDRAQRDDRDGLARPGAEDPAEVARHRSPLVRGRLRHRLLLPGLSRPIRRG